MGRDNWETAQKLRRKAADEAATTPEERAALIERAEMLEAKGDEPGPRKVGKFGVVIDSTAADSFISAWLWDLDEIIEQGYRGNREGEDW
jgi:hypothetical protein